MAELAAASGAAGLISLGLQACSGLITYCSACKEFDKDTRALKRRIQRLAMVLEYLDSMLSTPQFEEFRSAKLVQDSVWDCAEGIQELDELCKRYKFVPSSGNNLRRTTAGLVNRGLYPFRKRDLDSVSATLVNLQSNLSTAQQVLLR